MLLVFAEADPKHVPGSTFPVQRKFRSTVLHRGEAIPLVSVDHVLLAALDLVQVGVRSTSRYEVVVCSCSTDNEVKEGPGMFLSPGLEESSLEVLGSGDPDSFETLLGFGEGVEVETFPLRVNFGPVSFALPRLEVVAVAQGVAHLPQHEDRGFARQVHLLDDFPRYSVRHLTLVPVCPEGSTMDVPLPELRRDPLPPHVFPSQPPGYAPSSSNRAERRYACVFPFSSLSSRYETGSSLLSGLLFIRFRSAFAQFAPQNRVFVRKSGFLVQVDLVVRSNSKE